MAHRIALREVVIDVPTDILAAETAFWARALDTDARPLKDYAEFTELVDPAAGCVVGLQDIGSDVARYHVDIESDDVEAEVARLLRLGATEVSRHLSWVVLRDPAGLLVCVVPPDTADFDQRARTVD